MKKNLLFTFDYELFLGSRTGTVQDCMIEPTEKLISLFEDFKMKAVFFVDTTCLIRLKENAKVYDRSAVDFKVIAEQIQRLITKGHYVFPHLHPHWIDAEYSPDSNQWSLNNITHYRFHNITEQVREKLFGESISILLDIIRPVDADYKINGFRAGGWSLQPFSDFKPYFEKYGIVNDFSVVPGAYQLSNVQHFDFSRAPEKPIYPFEDDVTVEKQDGQFTELSISLISISKLTHLLNHLYLLYLFKIKKDHTYSKGQGQQPMDIEGSKPSSDDGKSMKNTPFHPASMETMNLVKIKDYLRYIKQNSSVQFVSHPKMLSNHNIRTTMKFLQKVTKKYEIESDFNVFIGSAIARQPKKKIINESNAGSLLPIEISVVIPCYNVGNYIKECLESVLHQTLLPIEIICVDDSSTDNTVEVIKSFVAQHPGFITLLKNSGVKGATGSRNTGLTASKGNFIQFLDADDLLLPEKFELHAKHIRDTDLKADILVGSFTKKFLDGTEKLYINLNMDPWAALIDNKTGVTSANIFKKSKLEEIKGWEPDLKSSQEYNLMFRMMKVGAVVVFDERILSHNRERESGSITKSDPKEKWKRYINLRIQILKYLESTHQLTEQRNQIFDNNLFNAIRSLYKYDRNASIFYYNQFLKGKMLPKQEQSINTLYLLIYNSLGFNVAQKVALLNTNKH